MKLVRDQENMETNEQTVTMLATSEVRKLNGKKQIMKQERKQANWLRA